MEQMIIGALIVVVVFIFLAMLADLFLSWAKSSCLHKWCEWGEPHNEKQHRQCSKCKMVERRFL